MEFVSQFIASKRKRPTEEDSGFGGETEVQQTSTTEQQNPAENITREVGPDDRLGSHKDNDESRMLIQKAFRRGTYGLRVLCSPPQPSVDIVFVHGLTGNSYKTWLEAESEIYWPVHLLRKDISDARILAFGYDADVTKFLGPVSQNNLRDHARELISDVAGLRAEDGSNERNIIFVAHSLGGLVTKKAICLSDEVFEPHLKQVHECVSAILFLGTPHRGSDITAFATGVANILKAGGKRVNKEILSLLHKDSEVLADVEDSFAQWMRKNSGRFNISCFYEELELRSVGRVVKKESAIIPGYPYQGIHANHMDITKFGCSDEMGYRRVLRELKRIGLPRPAAVQNQPHLPSDIKECLKSLAFPQMEDRHHDIDRAMNGTCHWLLSDPKYREWTSLPRSLLWISGKPGAGKSTLLKYIYQHFVQGDAATPKEDAIVITFFFHGRGTDLQKSPLGLYRSFLHQLLYQCPDHMYDLVQTFKRKTESMGHHGANWNWNEHELHNLFEASANAIAQYKHLHLFIDALDECGEKIAHKLSVAFQTYIRSFSACRISICFSCRQYPVLALPSALEILVHEQNGHDVATYVQNQDLDPQVSKAIIERSSGVFQWARLVAMLASELGREGESPMKILNEIERIPPDLDSLYRELFKSIRDHERAFSLKLMQWICFARRPLSLSELRVAMVIDKDCPKTSWKEMETSPEYTQTNDAMARRVKTLSRGLAEIRGLESGTVVQFIHQSVNDFFIQHGMRLLSCHSYSDAVATGLAHYRLSRSCIRYFSMDEVSLELSKLPELSEGPYLTYHDQSSHLELRFPFLRYAVTLWLVHTKASEAYDISHDDLLEYLHWPSGHVTESWARAKRILDLEPRYSSPAGPTLLHLVAMYGLHSVGLRILEQHNAKAGSKDFGKWTPLSLAAEHAHKAITPLLADCEEVKADSKDADGRTPLSYATANGHEAIVRMLVDREDVEADSKDDCGRTPLSYAAEYGHEAVTRLLLDREDVDANLGDGSGYTPLAYAALDGHEKVVRLLVDREDVEADAEELNGCTPLLYAAARGHEAIVRLLVDREDVDANSRGIDGCTPLSCAAGNGHEAVVRLLLDREDVEADSKDDYDRTPLLHAANNGHKAIIRLLVEREDVRSDPWDDWQFSRDELWRATGIDGK